MDNVNPSLLYIPKFHCCIKLFVAQRVPKTSITKKFPEMVHVHPALFSLFLCLCVCPAMRFVVLQRIELKLGRVVGEWPEVCSAARFFLTKSPCCDGIF